jgi:hypothetical protein
MAPHHMRHLKRVHLSSSNGLQSGSPTLGAIFKEFNMCILNNHFSAFDLCYVSDNVVLFHAYFCAYINIVSIIGGPLIGEHIMKLSTCENFKPSDMV